MGRAKEAFLGLKLNRKFTFVITLIVIMPIVALAILLFTIMKDNVIDENLHYMEYNVERSYDQILTNVDSINMSTQFFLSDSGLLELLSDSVSGGRLTAGEKLELYKRDIASLERLVNNNPSLYQVRVYGVNDEVQEMMPILYNVSRMRKLSWASDGELSGWKYDYKDTIFDSYTLNQNRSLISLITPVMDYNDVQIGTVEVAMTMMTMFPSLYEEIENEWSCVADNSGNIYFGDNRKAESRELAGEILEQMRQAKAERVYYSKINGRSLVIACQPIKELNVTLIRVNDITPEISYVYRVRRIFIAAMAALVVLLMLIVNAVVKYLLRKLYDILHKIREVQKGDLNVVIPDYGKDEMGELATQINKMLERIRQLMVDNINRERLAKNSQIRALQNQINAHFIYNVLESIKMMAEIDEKYEISNAITSLGKLLRYSMKWTSGNVTVRDEMEYIKDYMVLINLRFDYEIYLSVNMPEIILDQEIPKMSLQPIVENAIYHGIEEMAEDTNIYIKGQVLGDSCVIGISDAGRGMSEETVADLYRRIEGKVEASGGTNKGIGLKNVQDRIRMSFGPDYGIEIASKLGCYTKVSVRIPMKKQPQLEQEG